MVPNTPGEGLAGHDSLREESMVSAEKTFIHFVENREGLLTGVYNTHSVSLYLKLLFTTL